MPRVANPDVNLHLGYPPLSSRREWYGRHPLSWLEAMTRIFVKNNDNNLQLSFCREKEVKAGGIELQKKYLARPIKFPLAKAGPLGVVSGLIFNQVIKERSLKEFDLGIAAKLSQFHTLHREHRMATIAPNTTQEPQGNLPVDATYDPVDMPPFNPAIHLAFIEPSARHSFTELGLPRPRTAPDMCFTEPFHLFSEEGVRMIRCDLLRKEVLDKHMQSWVRAPCTISQHEDVATWINKAWNHPTTIECVSRAFGLPLKLLGRKGETGYCNVQLGPEGPAGVYKLGEVPSGPLDATASESQFDEVMTDAWHRDSTQVSCVVMLSDTSTMEGGETAIRIGDGSILEARGAKMGGAVLIQGAHLTHAALRATNAPERISMVTSFAFVDTRLDDSGTSLRSVDLLHPAAVGCQNHFLLHKLRRLQENVKNAIEQEEAANAAHLPPKRDEVEPWVEEQMTLLKQTSWELFERYPNHLYKDIPENAVREYLSHI